MIEVRMELGTCGGNPDTNLALSRCVSIDCPLVSAAFVGHDKYLEALIQAGADVNRPGPAGYTALIYAARNGWDKCVDILIKAGANVNMQDGFDGYTALKHAAFWGCDKCVELLIQAGADVNIQDREGYTALINAVEHGFDKCVELLVEAGADVNKQYRNGTTAVNAALRRQNTRCLKLLLRAGAGVNKSRADMNNWGDYEHLFGFNRHIDVVLYIAGTKIDLPQSKVPGYLKKLMKKPSGISLIHICREAIRNHMISVSCVNLFHRVPRLGLPSTLQEYLLLNTSLDDDN